ncbi:MAG: hypothetical protein ABJA82_02980 [Myxococcales bacterium]
MSYYPKLLALCLSTLGASALATGCSSSKSPAAPAKSPDAAATTLSSCAKNDLMVVFAPMYTAFDGTHTFQVPAVVQGVAADAISWSASDKTMVDLATDTNTGGVMISARKAGSVTIVASAGTLCGSSSLTISAASDADWQAGSARYNSGVVLPARGRMGMGMGAGGGGGDGAGGASMAYACTNCHGDTATSGPYKTVSHTPEQTGGFSDDALQNIFRNGTFPGGATDPNFDAKIVMYEIWSGFHKWSMSDDQAKGLIVYLRSLTPQAQTGAANFGGRFDGGVMRDGGGFGDGGRPNRDGGFTRPDGGAAGAAGTGGAGDTGGAGGGTEGSGGAGGGP